MNVALRKPRMTRDQFFAWAEGQDTRYEFDGFEPVAMTGGNARHNRVCQNLWAALRGRLQGNPCQPLGPDAGVATIGDRVRYPDALVSCARTEDTALVIENVVIVFEVLGPDSGHRDRIVKVREYHAVASIRRYIILEQRSVGASVFCRNNGHGEWTVTTLLTGDTLELPEVGVAFPLADLYNGTDLAVTAETGTPEGEATTTSSG